MNPERVDENTASVELEFYEVQIIANALAETCKRLDKDEFKKLVGADLEEAKDLMNQFRNLYDSMG